MAAWPSSVLFALTLLVLCECSAPHGARTAPPTPPGRCSYLGFGLHTCTRCTALYGEGNGVPAESLSRSNAVHGLMRLRGGQYRKRNDARRPHGVQPEKARKRVGPTTAAHGNAWD